MARQRNSGNPLGFLVLLGLPMWLLSKCAGGTSSPPVSAYQPPAPYSAPAPYASAAPYVAPSAPGAAEPARAPPSPGPATNAPDAPARLFVKGHRVPMRAKPDAKSAVLDRVDDGAAVAVLEQRAGWSRVRHPITAREGWIAGARLSEVAPGDEDDEEEGKPEAKPAPSAKAAMTVAAIAKLLIAQSIASYPSSCACPYQKDRGGRACGGRSAYSRPGGYAPLCYPGDVTSAMVAEFRGTSR